MTASILHLLSAGTNQDPQALAPYQAKDQSLLIGRCLVVCFFLFCSLGASLGFEITQSSGGWCSPVIADVKGGVLVEITGGAEPIGLRKSQPSVQQPGSSPDKLTQKTKGDASPAIARIGGSVHIICAGVSPKALLVMNAELEKSQKSLDERVRAADEWARRYRELKQFVDGLKLPSNLLTEAQGYIESGNFEKAEEFFLKIKLSGQKTAASGDFGLAQIARLRGKPDEALREFKSAYEADRENYAYGLAYGAALQEAGKLDEADATYRTLIDATQAPGKSELDDDEYQNLVIVKAKLRANLCGIRVTRKQLEDLDLNSCFGVFDKYQSVFYQSRYDRQRMIQHLNNDQRAMQDFDRLQESAHQYLIDINNKLVYVQALIDSPPQARHPDWDPVKKKRELINDRSRALENLTQQALQLARIYLPDTESIQRSMNPFVQQSLLANIAVAEWECSAEQRSYWSSHNEWLSSCWVGFSSKAKDLPNLDDLNLLSLGPSYAYVDGQAFLWSLELSNLRDTGGYKFPNWPSFDHFAAYQDDSWKAANEIYTRLTNVSSELRAKYSPIYATFLKNAIAALQTEPGSLRLKEAQDRLAKLPERYPETQSVPNPVGRPAWTIYFPW